MYALLSVSDKTGIVDFARALIDLDFTILSTGGTLKTLQEAGLEATEVGAFTGFPEMFEGRIKTLHPKIHGAILHRRDKPEHVNTAREHDISEIGLVCVNLYPFKATIEKTDDFETIIENIDIGGPAMVRSAAKNFQDVLIVTDSNDYDSVITARREQKDDETFRRQLMIKAFEHTAAYDSMIANYMNRRFNDGFGAKQFIVGQQVMPTRYGENPHQRGALYEFENYFSEHFEALKGEASFNNLTDINSAVKIASSFGKEPAVCIVKHGNPCGFSIQNNLEESYAQALKSDPLSAFGGVVAINGVLDETLAQTMSATFFEVIIAASVTPAALAVFEDKKRVKIFTHNAVLLHLPRDPFDFKKVEGGFVYQDADSVLDDEIAQAKCVTTTPVDEAMRRDLEIAYRVSALVKSNCVVYVKEGTAVAIGMGMTSRVDASLCALKKAKEQNLDVTGAVLASEAFFPFRDSIDAAAKSDVKAIIQPGGSIRDEEVIAAANEHGIAMLFTGRRHFLH